MYCHLVAVEVRVVRGADQRVQSQCAALNQHRFKGLNAQTVEGRRAVEEHGVFLDDIFQRIPNLGALLVNHLLGGLDVVGYAVLNELFHNKGAE